MICKIKALCLVFLQTDQAFQHDERHLLKPFTEGSTQAVGSPLVLYLWESFSIPTAMDPCLIFCQNNIKPTGSSQWRGAIRAEVAQILVTDAEYLHSSSLAALQLQSAKWFKRQVCSQEKGTHA